MAFPEITKLSLSANRATIGSDLIIAFTLKNTIKNSGQPATITSVTHRLFGKTSEFTYALLADGVTLKKWINYGESVNHNISFKVTGSQGANNYFEENQNKRALPMYLEITAYYQFGGGYSFETTKLDLSAFYLKSFCMPTLLEFDIERSTGAVPSDEGEDVLSTLKLSLNQAADTSTMALQLHYAENGEATTDSAYIDLTSEIPRLLIGVTNSTDLIFRQFSNGSNWDFLLFFGDEYESVTAKQSFVRAFANLHLSGAKTGGACFGGFSSSSEGDPKLESYYPGHFYSGIHGVNIFSYQEVKTGGRWADNKPLYTKVVAITDAVSGVVQNADMPADVESIWIDPSASFCITSSGVVYPLSYTSSNGASMFLANCNLSQRKIYSAAYAGGTADLYIKIFYTKTTDEAIAPVQTHAQLIDADDAAMVEKSGLSFYAEEYDNTVYKSTYTGRQIDAGIANALNALLVTGGTMTGPLILSGNPAEPLGAVTKQYLETKLGEIALTPGPPGSPGAPGVGIIDITIEEVV